MVNNVDRKRSKSNNEEIRASPSLDLPRKLSHDAHLKRGPPENRLDLKSMVSYSFKALLDAVSEREKRGYRGRKITNFGRRL